MFSDREDSGSRSSREVSPASSSSITSIIIQVTTTRRQVSEPLPIKTMTEPTTPSTPALDSTTMIEERSSSTRNDARVPTASNRAGHSSADDGRITLDPTNGIADFEGATVSTTIPEDEAPVAPVVTRTHPTPILRRSYIIRTKWNTPIPRFRELIGSLPDQGNGVVLIVESLPWQKYITMLSNAEVELVRDHEIVATIEPDAGYSLSEEIKRR